MDRTTTTESAAATGKTGGRSAFHLQLDHWLLGLVRGCIQGGAVAVKATLGTAGIGNVAQWVGVNVPALDARQFVTVFLGGFLWHFFDFLARNPLPDEDDGPEKTQQEGTEIKPSTQGPQ